VNAQADVSWEHRAMDENYPMPDDLRAAIAIAVRDEIRQAQQSGTLSDQHAFLTIREVTRVLNCSRTEVYRRVRAGDLRSRRILFDAGCVRAYADRLRSGGACK
jgi:hypothetical protein